MSWWVDLKCPFTRWVAGKYHLDRRFLALFLLSTFCVYTFIFFSLSNSSFSLTQITQYYTVPAGIRSVFFSFPSSSFTPPASDGPVNLKNDAHDEVAATDQQWRSDRSESKESTRIAVCLVGGARRFELTGQSIIDRVLRKLPNSDLFLNCPFDVNSYKLSLLRNAPRIASVRIFKPVTIPEKMERRSEVLSPAHSPNGIQGLLQYFQLVEGCLTMIEDYETKHNFTYDWIIRTRVDSYWSSSIKPSSIFIRDHYVVPIGSTFGGLNDRLGIGDRNTSTIALSRLSLIHSLYNKGFRKLNSETAFKAQLTTHNISFLTIDQPFCVVSDRTYPFPLGKSGVPVAAISSPGPLNGAKCRPCKPACVGPCVVDAMQQLKSRGSWTKWEGGRLELCDARNEWETGWEDVFDQSVGKKLANVRKRVVKMKMKECLRDFEKMRNKVVGEWDTPPLYVICRFGLNLTTY